MLNTMLETKYFVNKETGLLYEVQHDNDNPKLTKELSYTADSGAKEVTKEEYDTHIEEVIAKMEKVLSDARAKYEEFEKTTNKAREALVAKLAKKLDLSKEEAALMVAAPEFDGKVGMEVTEKI